MRFLNIFGCDQKSSRTRTARIIAFAAVLAAATTTFASADSPGTDDGERVPPQQFYNPFLEYVEGIPPDTACEKNCFKTYFEERYAKDKAADVATQEFADRVQQHFSNLRIVPDISRLYHVTPEEDLEELEAVERALEEDDSVLLADFIDDDVGSIETRRMNGAGQGISRKATDADSQLQKKRKRGNTIPRRRFLIPQSTISSEQRQRKGDADTSTDRPPVQNARTFFGLDAAPDASADASNVFAGSSSDKGSSSSFTNPFNKLRDSLPTTTGECTQCSDSVFVSTALAAEDACAEPLALLEKSAGSSGSDLETDLAWSAFCASDCFMKMSLIPLSHYCCLGDTAPAFLNIIMACKTSKQPGHETRYCGAEMSNLLAVGCNFTTAAECRANGKFCEWYANTSTCFFRATEANLDYVCTECARSYLELFPAGGLYNYTVHAMMGGVYGGFCNKIENQFCYLTSARRGYTMAHTATSADYVEMCKKDPQTITDRLCHRVTAIRTSEAIRRNALHEWIRCNISEAADQDCDYTCAGGFLVGFAIEKSSMLMCSHDPSSRGGMICPRVVNEQLRSNPCIMPVRETGVCPSTCDYRVSAAANRMGCCGPVFGLGGFDYANQAPYPTRYLIGATAMGLSYVNNQSFVSPPGVLRPPRSNSEFAILEERAERLTNANSLAAFANCSSFQINFAFWTQNITSCVQTPSQRTYYIRLHLNYANLQNCVNRDFVYSALKADIAATTGISRPQIVQTYIAEDPETKVMMMGSRRSYDGVLMVLTVQSDSDEMNQAMDANILRAKAEGRFVFPTAGVETMMNCPNVMPNSYTPIFVDMWPAPVAGNAPILANSASAASNSILLVLAVLAATLIAAGSA